MLDLDDGESSSPVDLVRLTYQCHSESLEKRDYGQLQRGFDLFQSATALHQRHMYIG